MKNSKLFISLSCIIPALLISCIVNLTAQNDLIGYTYILTLDGHSYYISDCEATWEEANEAATEMGGYLATMSSHDENFYLGVWLNNNYISYDNYPGAWIGLYREEGNYEWSGEDGCCQNFLIVNDLIYANFAAFTIGDITSFDYNFSYSFGWIAHLVSMETEYIVEFTSQPNCNNNPNKAYVCHNGNTICVNATALQSHLDHGDLEGPCGPCNTPAMQSLPEETIVTDGHLHQIAKVAHSELNEGPDRVQKFPASDQIQVFPNPASEIINVALPDIIYEGSLRILSSTGQEIHAITLHGQQSMRIDISGYALGLYLIDVRSENGHYQKKIVRM